jgi:hypothetical protein
MKTEDIEAIDRAELNHDCGYDDRWQNKPFNENETEAWKRGWKEADYELSGCR